MGEAELSAQQEPAPAGEIDGFFRLIQLVMKRKRLSVRELAKRFPMRNRAQFLKRLDKGQLLHSETMECLRALDIDLNRAWVVVFQLKNPDLYFDAIVETTSNLQIDLAQNLQECLAACEGDFEPLRRGLTKSLAAEVGSRVVDHQKRVRQARLGVT